MNILCIDDEELVLEMMVTNCRRLRPNDSVEGFDDPFEGIAYAKTHPVDLAFLDIDMPEMDGLRLSEELKKFNPRVNIVFVTAYPQYALEAFSVDSSGYLLKPVSIEQLKHQIEVLRFPVKEDTDHKNDGKLTIRCFGNFEVFIDEEPVLFSYSKTKELLALLVDNQGAMCSYPYLIDKLWGDGKNHSEYFKSLRRDLIESLTDIEQKSALITPRGELGIRRTDVDCDYYNYLEDQNSEYYHGEYMNQYVWAEETKQRLNRRLSDAD